MWDRGLHSAAMVQATRKRECDYRGRAPAQVRFVAEKVLAAGSDLNWIDPDAKSQKKGGTKILWRLIEYTIDSAQGEKTDRLITSLLDTTLFSALLLASESHQRWEGENTIAQLKTHLLGRKTPSR